MYAWAVYLNKGIGPILKLQATAQRDRRLVEMTISTNPNMGPVTYMVLWCESVLSDILEKRVLDIKLQTITQRRNNLINIR